MSRPRPLQLLAPARDLTVGLDAIKHGADAVYIGPEAFGARSRAGNSITDIERLVAAARPWHVRVLATVNTLIYDNELERVKVLVRDLYNAGVDALIIQDMGLLELDLPPIALHASTQCDTRTPAQARLLKDLGFSQIVLPREMSLDEINVMAQAASPARIEAFVHGALCVCYSGDCRASLVNNWRSANRGECAQMCRLPYTLTDGRGNVIGAKAHYLSLRDLNRLDRLADMAAAGVSSFKIEGRLKESAYVKNVVAAYRRALDSVIASHPDLYCHASAGHVTTTFTPDVDRTFNRRYTTYFIDGHRNIMPGSLAGINTPKAVGTPVGTVINSHGNIVTAKLTTPIANGDGLTYITPDGDAAGFRVNRAEGNRLILHGTSPALPPGTALYRSYDKLFDETLAADNTAERCLDLELTLRRVDETTLALSGQMDNGRTVTVTATADIQPSRTPDNGRRREALSRLGGTHYRAVKVTDLPADLFVPISVISRLRQSLVSMLDTTMAVTFERERRLPRQSDITVSSDEVNDLRPLIANRAARQFYRHLTDGKIELPDALEIDLGGRQRSDLRVMTTRYCLRRELGYCLKTERGKLLTPPLHLTAPAIDYRLDFDCANCQMHVIANPRR